MSAEAELFSLLSGAAGVTALVGSRIYPDAIPEDKPLPAVVFTRAETAPIVTVSGQKVGEDVKFQVVSWAETRTDADAVAEQIETVLASARQPATNRMSGFDGEVGLFAVTIEATWFSTT